MALLNEYIGSDGVRLNLVDLAVHCVNTLKRISYKGKSGAFSNFFNEWKKWDWKPGLIRSWTLPTTQYHIPGSVPCHKARGHSLIVYVFLGHEDIFHFYPRNANPLFFHTTSKSIMLKNEYSWILIRFHFEWMFVFHPKVSKTVFSVSEHRVLCVHFYYRFPKTTYWIYKGMKGFFSNEVWPSLILFSVRKSLKTNTCILGHPGKQASQNENSPQPLAARRRVHQQRAPDHQ